MSVYSALILSDAPALYWRLNETGAVSGGSNYGDGTYGGSTYGGGAAPSNTVLDFSGNGNDGTILWHESPGTAGVTQNVDGGTSDGDAALAINGSGDSSTEPNKGTGVRANAYQPYRPGAKLSLECWLYKRDSAPSMETLFSGDGMTGGLVHPTWEFNVNDDGSPTFRFYTSVAYFPTGWRDWGSRSAWSGRPADFTNWFPVTDLKFESLKWQHIVCTYDDVSGIAELFVNGRSQGQLGPAGYFQSHPTFNPSGNAGLFQIGFRGHEAAPGNGEVLNGVMDEVAVYERILSPTEILQHYLVGAQGFQPAPATQPPIRVTTETPAGRGHDLTEKIEGLQWSSVNPGGDEAASFTYRRPWSADLPEIAIGSIVRVTYGIDVLWQGRIEELSRAGDETEYVAVTAYGLGNRLKDAEMQEIYVDRSAERWQAPTLNWRIALTTLDKPLDTDYHASADEQSLAFSGTDHTTISSGSSAYLEYVMPEGLLASELQYEGVERNVASENAAALGWTNDDTVPLLGTTALTLANDGVARSAVIDQPSRFLFLSLASASSHTPTKPAHRTYRMFAVYGNHGLARQDNGSEPDGFTADQIVADAVGRVEGVVARRIDSGSFVIDHLVYADPIPHEDVITEVNAYEGADWGTWGPESVLDRSSVGYFDYTARDPASQHWLISRADLDSEPDLSSDTTNLYDTVKIAFTDETGTDQVVELSRTIDALEQAGIHRTAKIDGGQLTEHLALGLGLVFFALQGDFAPARGSVTIAKPIRHHQRGLLPPVYMRADGSNVRLADILPAQSLFALDSGPDRRSTFPIKRVSVDASGPVVLVTAELDQSFDAFSILQARLALGAEFLPVVRVPGRDQRHRRH